MSGKEPHIIKEMVVGQTYTMTELLPAPGYVTAESIRFTVEDTAEVQKIEMKDDVTRWKSPRRILQERNCRERS